MTGAGQLESAGVEREKLAPSYFSPLSRWLCFSASQTDQQRQVCISPPSLWATTIAPTESAAKRGSRMQMELEVWTRRVDQADSSDS